jgi:nitrate reductase NapD
VNLSGILVHAHPERREAVKGRLLALPGVEVHADTGDGRLVVTVEEAEAARMAQTVLRIHGIEGVLSAALVYQYCDDDPAGEKPL